MADIGTLFAVGTPIGNLEDVTLRALRVLRDVSLIAAEDTRRTRMLLAHYGIATPLISYREQNRATATAAILQRLRDGSVALVSDAGMPAISDPGAELVAAVLAQGGRVEVVPGASAVITALVGSGLPAAPFTFAGFLSRQRGDRRRYLETLAPRPDTLVFYEAPHRLRETLRDLLETFGDREAAVCRELTKRHEETRRGTLSALAEHFDRIAPRGEITLVVRGRSAAEQAAAAPSDADIDARLAQAMREGADMRLVVAELAAAAGRPRRAIYARWQVAKRELAGG